MGNSGMGSVTHMVPLAMAAKAGIRIIHVPFGTGLAMAALSLMRCWLSLCQWVTHPREQCAWSFGK